MCYLIAKKFYNHGCIALETNFGEDLKNLSDYLTSRTVGKNVEILTVNNIQGYPEYRPYTIIKSKEVFINKTIELIDL